MTSKRSIGWFLENSWAWTFFSPERSLNQPKATRVCIRSINQSNRSISVRLLFLFCSRVFIPRSYENRSNIIIYMMLTLKCLGKIQSLIFSNGVIIKHLIPRSTCYISVKKRTPAIKIYFPGNLVKWSNQCKISRKWHPHIDSPNPTFGPLWEVRVTTEVGE